MPDWIENRAEMVRTQIQERGVRHTGVLAAMLTVPRELFMPPEVRHMATVDSPVGIGQGQTISQPYIVALMAEAALGERRHLGAVLEVGTGCGYGAAVLAAVADHVTSIERLESLAVQARSNLDTANVHNVTVFVGDGTLGLPSGAPYNAIVVTAAGPVVPHALTDQLADGGRLVVPVGSTDEQQLIVVTRQSDDTTTESLGSVRFVPLIGEQGWRE